MAGTQRLTILNASLALLSASASYEVAQPYLVPWGTQISQPAIMLRYVGDKYHPKEAFGLPQPVVLDMEVWIYAKAETDQPPQIVFAPLLDALDTALAANSTFDGRQDLGMPDIVHHAWIEGEATYSQGELGDQIVCMLPFHVWVTGGFQSP